MIGDCKGKFYRSHHSVNVPYECGERIVGSTPNQKNVINEAYPVNNVVRAICLVDKSVFQSAHPIYTFAKLGAALVPIAVPFTCINCS